MKLLILINVLISLVMVGIPLYLKSKPPKGINMIYGYRTSRTIKNPALWSLANKIWPIKLLRYSTIAFLFQVLLFFVFNPAVSLLSACVLWLIAIGMAIYKTEKSLIEFSRNEQVKKEVGKSNSKGDLLKKP